jgi:hypothetical protein
VQSHHAPAVTDDAVSLHLSKAQAAVACAALHRLPRQDLRGAPAAAVDLEVHHVLQALVVSGVHVDERGHLAAGVPVVHHLGRTAQKRK